MRKWMLNAPRWVLALVTGVPFGLWMVLFGRFFQDVSWTQALVSGGIAGVFFGAAMGVYLHRLYRRTREAVGDLSNAEIKRAGRASVRGPVPADAEIRAAAHGLAISNFDLLRRQRVWALPFLALMLGAGIFLTVTEGAGWWIPIAFCAILGAVTVYLPRHLRRRIELLQATPQD